jgi:glycine/D-amino acid oxidase-like deaminating enzyme
MSGGAPSGRYDAVVIGAGFYGCCVALFLRSVYRRVLVLERAPAAMTRASAVNQARIHAGFHYPRSFVTALRSVRNMPRFVALFEDAVVDDFTMLYAISRRDSKVSANRFERMFGGMGTGIRPATAAQRTLFNPALVERVFACHEAAFDWTRIRSILLARLAAVGVEVSYDVHVSAVIGRDSQTTVVTATGEVAADVVINATYSEINAVLGRSGVTGFAFKHEWTEVALIDPPAALAGLAVTVMDGPFFSTMPYPAASAYSLTHVRYTPHSSWVDAAATPASSVLHDRLPRVSRWYHMVADARRYLPCIGEARWRGSLYDVKTVMMRNEGDDGRPILLQRHDEMPGLYSVLGGKIDNIFDLFDAMRVEEPAWSAGDLRHLDCAA